MLIFLCSVQRIFITMEQGYDDHHPIFPTCAYMTCYHWRPACGNHQERRQDSSGGLENMQKVSIIFLVSL
ncbi:hypothetical protein GDO78_020099 [Eleutherodactylus coqui]|uniref:Uncharacterized protein n=1 Tax=Eleutherodactylus coqui TaxID=57060 RepID=A0A8J6B5A6_ELECQ|nr:hypothetical protein GDO78_020099 [Eleutherodactylus coqui]